ncbi:MAG: hypothetical protein KDI71_09970 [Xanthomonadales bacterium]|nr:hypothetical protein [Xanthomonadales bacterium]
MASSLVAAEPSGVQSPRPVRLILCVLGPANWLTAAARCVRDFGRGFRFDEEFSAEGWDDRMPASFGVSWNQIPPTFDEDDLTAIIDHRSLAYALSEPMSPPNSLTAAADAVRLVDRLIKVGAIACKCETGGVAHGVRHWRRFAEGLNNPSHSARNRILYRALVRRPLDDEGVLYSAGMHSLGLPDIDYRGRRDLLAATAMIDRVGLAALAGEAIELRHRPCTHYSPDALLYNPYGNWLIDETGQ